MRNEKSEVGNEDCECSLPISHMACTDILGEIELDPEKWEMRLRRESPSLKFSPLARVILSTLYINYSVFLVLPNQKVLNKYD